MLVLCRKVGEVIVIGEGDQAVKVSVVAMRGNFAVRLGIEAPAETRVDRLEVAKRRASVGEGRSEAA